MELNESTKLKPVREKLFNLAKKSELYKNVTQTNGKIVFGRGNDEAKILFMGEAPGFSENEQGRPFVGRSGALLGEWIKHIGLNEKNYAVINAVPIIPLSADKKIRPPTEQEIKYFQETVKEIIKEINPEIVVLLGKSAARAFGLEEMKVGETRNVDEKKFFFIYHPAYYLRNGKKGFEDADKMKNVLEKHENEKKQSTLKNF